MKMGIHAEQFWQTADYCILQYVPRWILDTKGFNLNKAKTFNTDRSTGRRCVTENPQDA